MSFQFKSLSNHFLYMYGGGACVYVYHHLEISKNYDPAIASLHTLKQVANLSCQYKVVWQISFDCQRHN